MDILETLGLSGENIPQEYGHGISKDVIKAQKEEEERIKYLNDLKYQLDITRQQLNTANQTNKQIVEENNSLKIDVDAKESVINVLVKSILPKFDELQKTVNSS
jgi:serine phosphatase RsbU (regulator of sigma subunit)